MMARFDADVPFNTEYERCAPKMRAMLRSLAPTGPLWPNSEPSAPRSMPMSVRNRFSPKKSKNTRPTGDLRNATPPWCPGAAHEYSRSRS
jgi:hypothetical protein